MNELKAKVARSALEYVETGAILGVGTGSTIAYLIQALASIKSRIDACVASSKETEAQLRAIGLPVIDLNVADEVPLYIDGADQVSARRELLKGGGGALTREKILATAAKYFICIVDESKFIKHLGTFPLAVEVIPMARSFVARELVKLGGDPVYREGFVTDNSNIILDVHGLPLVESLYTLEDTINTIPGVVENGLFTKRIPDKVLIGKEEGVSVLP